MSDKLLQALRQKYKSPQEACEALSLDAAAILPPDARYALAQDGCVTDKHTSQTYDKATFMRALFETKEDPMLSTLQRKLAQLARDADLPSVAGIEGHPKPNITKTVGTGDGDTPNGTPPSGEECIQFVKLCMQGLEGDELQTLLGGLNDLLSTGAGAPMGAGDDTPNNNRSAISTNMDRKRGARDNQMVRPKAMDTNIRALNHSGFMKRHPYLNVDVWR